MPSKWAIPEIKEVTLGFNGNIVVEKNGQCSLKYENTKRTLQNVPVNLSKFSHIEKRGSVDEFAINFMFGDKVITQWVFDNDDDRESHYRKILLKLM